MISEHQISKAYLVNTSHPCHGCYGQLRIEVELNFKTDAISRGQSEAAHICRCDLSCAINGIVGELGCKLSQVSRTCSQCRSFSRGISENAVAHTEASGQAAGAGQNSLFKAGMFKSNRMFKPNASETLSSQAFRNDTGRKADMEVVKRMLLSPSSRHFIYRIHI